MYLNGISVKSIVLAIIGFFNLLSYFLYYSDKKKAKSRQRRIPESTLLFVSFFFGGLGAWLGMKQFRHKTNQLKFKVLVPIATLLTAITIYFVLNLN